MGKPDMHDLGKHRCPECTVITKFLAMGPYRALCENCGALIKNEELKIEKEK